MLFKAWLIAVAFSTAFATSVNASALGRAWALYLSTKDIFESMRQADGFPIRLPNGEVVLQRSDFAEAQQAYRYARHQLLGFVLGAAWNGVLLLGTVWFLVAL